MAALIPHEKDNDGGLEDILRECNNFNQCRLELLEDNEEIEVFCKKEKKHTRQIWEAQPFILKTAKTLTNHKKGNEN